MLKNDSIVLFGDNITGNLIAFDKSDSIYINYSENDIKRFLKSENIKNKISLNSQNSEFNYILVNVTNDCNLNCKYCYVQKKKEYMSLDIIIKTIRYAYCKKTGKKKLFVVFHGGEPLLMMDRILEAIDSLVDINSEINYMIQTNGVILNKKNIEKLISRNVFISISIDGFTTKNNENRFTNKEVLLNDIWSYMATYTNRIGAILVINEQNIENIVDIAMKLIDIKVNSFSFNLIYHIDGNNQSHLCQEKLIEETKKLIDILWEKNVKEGLLPFEKYKERNIYLLYRRLLYKDYSYMCMNTPCGAGKNIISVEPNGDIYPCNIVSSMNNIEFRMGNIMDGRIINKVGFSRNLDMIENCSECELKNACGGGGCNGFLYLYMRNQNQMSYYCKYYKEISLYLIKKSLKYSGKSFLTNFMWEEGKK